MDAVQQVRFGQYFTPVAAAALIASMPRLRTSGLIRVLDPGAGTGVLSAAVVERLLREAPNTRIELTVVEVDSALVAVLEGTMQECRDSAIQQGAELSVSIVVGNYIDEAEILGERFDLVIMNPPYGKISGSSRYRSILAKRSIFAPNLYAAFMALGVLNLAPGGQLVSITPRSFTNGSSFAKFRDFYLEQMGLDRIHLFTSRTSLFAEGGVLQENIVLSATRGIAEREVVFSDSVDHNDLPVVRSVAAREVVKSGDHNRFIRIPSQGAESADVLMMDSLTLSLADTALDVSTGRVVDFRSKENLSSEPSPFASPMVYASNLENGRVVHPRVGDKPQWFDAYTDRDLRMCFPSGCYVLVKRFSSQEERRRVVAAVWMPGGHEDVRPVAFDNKVNVLHVNGAGLDLDTAIGAERWLNSTLVDQYFRTFSGHTQINANDLRAMPFPDAAAIRKLGRALLPDKATQSEIDTAVLSIVFESGSFESLPFTTLSESPV